MRIPWFLVLALFWTCVAGSKEIRQASLGSFSIMHLVHDAIRGGIGDTLELLESDLPFASPSSGDVFADELHHLHRAIDVHTSMEENGSFLVMDALFDGIVTQSGLIDSHAEDERLKQDVMKALIQADPNLIESSVKAWADHHVTHLSEEEQVLLPLYKRVCKALQQADEEGDSRLSVPLLVYRQVIVPALEIAYTGEDDDFEADSKRREELFGSIRQEGEIRFELEDEGNPEYSKEFDWFVNYVLAKLRKHDKKSDDHQEEEKREDHDGRRRSKAVEFARALHAVSPKYQWDRWGQIAENALTDLEIEQGKDEQEEQQEDNGKDEEERTFPWSNTASGVTELALRTISVPNELRRLWKSGIFDKHSVSSSDSDVEDDNDDEGEEEVYEEYEHLDMLLKIMLGSAVAEVNGNDFEVTAEQEAYLEELSEDELQRFLYIMDTIALRIADLGNGHWGDLQPFKLLIEEALNGHNIDDLVGARHLREEDAVDYEEELDEDDIQFEHALKYGFRAKKSRKQKSDDDDNEEEEEEEEEDQKDEDGFANLPDLSGIIDIDAFDAFGEEAEIVFNDDVQKVGIYGSNDDDNNGDDDVNNNNDDDDDDVVVIGAGLSAREAYTSGKKRKFKNEEEKEKDRIEKMQKNKKKNKTNKNEDQKAQNDDDDDGDMQQNSVENIQKIMQRFDEAVEQPLEPMMNQIDQLDQQISGLADDIKDIVEDLTPPSPQGLKRRQQQLADLQDTNDMEEMLAKMRAMREKEMGRDTALNIHDLYQDEGDQELRKKQRQRIDQLERQAGQFDTSSFEKILRKMEAVEGQLHGKEGGVFEGVDSFELQSVFETDFGDLENIQDAFTEHAEVLNVFNQMPVPDAGELEDLAKDDPENVDVDALLKAFGPKTQEEEETVE